MTEAENYGRRARRLCGDTGYGTSPRCIFPSRRRGQIKFSRESFDLMAVETLPGG
jgi:hypothetical protein